MEACGDQKKGWGNGKKKGKKGKVYKVRSGRIKEIRIVGRRSGGMIFE
ncbi:hypothetical protein [Bacillus pseudomycoides]|nr:hypothetical protein [Bacillus pseudomycoides]